MSLDLVVSIFSFKGLFNTFCVESYFLRNLRASKATVRVLVNLFNLFCAESYFLKSFVASQVHLSCVRVLVNLDSLFLVDEASHVF